jgi:multicomponent Na+:H+ antiporter subunit B
MREVTGVIFILGLALLLAGLLAGLPFGGAPMEVGQAMVHAAPEQVGTANIVTSVVLAYRGLDTLGELTILFVAATAAGMVLGRRRADAPYDPPGGFILRTAADLLFPFLMVLGAYIIVHGHLTPGGGFQGGAILAAAFVIPLLGRPAAAFDERLAAVVEGLAGAAFITLGLAALWDKGYFLAPLLGRGETGQLLSAGSLPLLYLAVGLKVGAELASLLARMSEAEASD